MKESSVWILGGAQTDFSKNYNKQQQTIGDVLADSFGLAMQKHNIELSDIDSIHVGNFVGELFTGQGHLGAMLQYHFPELDGTPSSRHEAACASGSMACLSGMREIEAGIYDLVAVSGVEMMKNTDGKTAAKHLGAAAHVETELNTAKFPWVNQFSSIKNYYQERFGIKDEHLAYISELNYSNASKNPNAQTRHWEMTAENFSDSPEMNPIIEGSLRKSDCGRITDGSATVFLASESYARKYAQERNLSFEDIPRIKGWGHRTSPIDLAHKLNQADNNEYPFPQVHKAISDALTRAQLSTATQLDAIETHDCFTISEYVAIEHFGLSKPGEAWKMIESDDISLTGSTPINPSGGLIGCGHPVGATGVRMLVDAHKQVCNAAEEYQVPNAKNVGTLNIGGSLTTIASFVVGK